MGCPGNNRDKDPILLAIDTAQAKVSPIGMAVLVWATNRNVWDIWVRGFVSAAVSLAVEASPKLYQTKPEFKPDREAKPEMLRKVKPDRKATGSPRSFS